jgi:teichuronic acid biosynthesis glycosyltransferase TuaG
LAQTYENWELLVIDDGSSDNGYAVVKEYSIRDKRIKLLKNEKNSGVTKTRNRGTEAADGRYIAFLDSDDMWHREKLEKQMNFMKSRDAAISCTAYTRIDREKNEKKVIHVKEEITYNMLLKTNMMGCLTVIYDTEKTGKRYFTEAEKSEDYILWLSMVREFKTAYGLDETLAYYRVLDNSRSSNKLKVVKFQWKIYRKYEKLSLFKTIYCFIFYILEGTKKNL